MFPTVSAVQPLCTVPLCSTSFSCSRVTASAAPSFVGFVCEIRASTVLRRSVAVTGFFSGLYCDGFSTMPASVAACTMVSLAAVVLKYVSAAASTPQAPLPKYESFRYPARMSCLDRVCATWTAMRSWSILRDTVSAAAAACAAGSSRAAG